VPGTQIKCDAVVDGHCDGELTSSPMVGRSSETLPTRVQILALAPFPGIFLGFIDVVRFVVSGILVNNEVPIVTSGISRTDGCSVLQRCS
jgi:hypothetical protein